MLNLKQGKAEAYSELVEKAINATDKIMSLKSKHGSTAKHREPLEFESYNNESVNKSGDKNNVLMLLNMLQLAIMQGKTIRVETIGDIIGDIASGPDINNSFTLGNCDNVIKETEQKVIDSEHVDRKKKLVSGKCTKPDETDIKLVIRFTDEKLDPWHTNGPDRVFYKLNAQLLIAGELEIAAMHEISENERLACIHIAKTICYHSAYLKDGDLQEGYDQVMKSVEQGVNNWFSNLGSKLHDLYDYQANKQLRERIQGESQKNSDKTAKQTAIASKSDKFQW